MPVSSHRFLIFFTSSFFISGKIKRAMEIVNLLGAKFLRVSASDIDFETGYEKQREIFREDCFLVSDIAKKVKVVVTIEQHSLSMAASAGQILDLMRGIDISHIGIVYDPGNTVFEGYERVKVQIEMLKHLIKNVHLKNCIIKGGNFTEEGWLPSEVTKIDKGVLNWKEIILNLKKNGYDGFLTLEDFSEANWSLRERLDQLFYNQAICVHLFQNKSLLKLTSQICEQKNHLS